MTNSSNNLTTITQYIEVILNRKILIVPEENIFSIGFDSIHMMALANLLKKEGYQVTFAELLKSPTLKSWANLLHSKIEKAEIVNDFSTVTEFPLAPMQHAYWIGAMDNQILGNVAAHLYVEFDGKNINSKKLTDALEHLVKRHEMLRVEILDSGLQRILPTSHQNQLIVNDLSELSQTNVKRELSVIRIDKSNQKLMTRKKQPFEITLTLLPNHQFRLHVDIDMLAADAMSYRIILNELAILYEGKEQLPKINYSFKDYILTKKNQSLDRKKPDQKWWFERIKTFPEALNFPLNNEKAITDASAASREFYWISPEERASIEEFSRINQVTTAMTLLTIFAEAIGTHAKNKRFFLNLPLFDREQLHTDVELLVGDFSSSILVEIDLSKKQTIIDRIKSISQSFVMSATHSSYSALEVLRDLSRERGTTVLAPVVYTCAIGLGELFSKKVTQYFGKPVWILSQGPQVLLDAQVTEFEGGFLANWDIRKELFLPGVVDTMFATYQENIRNIVNYVKNKPKYFQSTAVHLQIKERAKYNGRKLPVNNNILHQKFYQFAKQQPNKQALLWQENKLDKSLSYQELASLSLKVAYFLKEKGVKKGDKVALSLYKGSKQIAILLGVLALGAVYVPIGINQPEARKNTILKTSEANFYIVENNSLFLGNTNVKIIGADECFKQDKQIENPIIPTPESIAYIIFTSGSTGAPKGVEVTHQAVMNTLEVANQLFDLTAVDISLAFSSLEFDLSIQDIFGLFNVGGSSVMITDEERYDADRLIFLINHFQVTQLYAVPSLLEMLLSSRNKGLMPSLKILILGGDKIHPLLYQKFHNLNPTCRFVGMGGATETAIHCTYFEVTAKLDSKWGCIPYGYPLFNNTCRVVDESGNDCANWVIGELWVGGKGIANGYINMPEKTQERFVKRDGITWYRTGDLVRYTDTGIIDYIGRLDNQVKLRGYRIEIDEIESVINRIAEVKNSVALVVKDKGINLIAFVQLKELQQISIEGIKTYLQKYLPPYMIPQKIIIINEFPLNSNAKIDRKELFKIYELEISEQDKTLPSTPLECLIAKQFSIFTGVSCVYLEDDFFALGGDSVLAIQLISALRQKLDYENIVIADLFENHTVKSFINRIKQTEPEKGLLEATAEILLELDEVVGTMEMEM